MGNSKPVYRNFLSTPLKKAVAEKSLLYKLLSENANSRQTSIVVKKKEALLKFLKNMKILF